MYLYVLHYTPLGQLKQYQFSRRRRSEPISAHLWAEIGSKNLLPAPRTHRQGKKTYAKDCGVCSSLFQKSWNKTFPCLPASLRDSLNPVPTPFFELEQDFSAFTCGFARLFQLFQFSTSLIYVNTYIDPFLYSFSRALGLKIIGTNGTFTRNAW